MIGVVVALVVLLITFGSLVAAGMPLLTAILGVGIGITGITTLTGFVDLSLHHAGPRQMLGLAVGIDYALFIVSRYRHELRERPPPEEAAGRAVGTAGSAVVFAGLTVVIALAGLSVVRHPVPDPDGPGRRRHRARRGADRAHPAAGAARLRRQRVSAPEGSGSSRAATPRATTAAPTAAAGSTLVTRFKVPALLVGRASPPR